MVKKEYSLTLKQRMNMEQKSVMELLDKCLFINLSDEEKIKHLGYIKACRLRYLEFEKQLIMEKQSSNKKIENYFYSVKKSNI